MLIHSDALAFVIVKTCIGEVRRHVWLATRCHQDVVGFYCDLLAFLLKQDSRAVDALHASSHVEGDAAFLQEFAQALGDVAIHHGKAFLEVLHDGHLASELLEDARKLHADDASADDAEALGQFLQAEQLGGRANVLSVGTRDGQHLCAATCGDDDVGSRYAAHRIGVDEDALLANQRDVGVGE